MVLGKLIDVFLVVGDNGFGDGLADGVDLRDVTTARHSDTDVDTGELVEADEEDGFVDLWWARCQAGSNSVELFLELTL